jgi:CRP-like cAMP-binding protein
MFLEYKAPPEYFFPLRADDLFCGLAPKSFAFLAKIHQTKQFEKGVRFFSGGDSVREVYILRKGKARLLLNDEFKNLRVARTIELNELFGLTEMLAGLPCATDARAITLCTCECFERADFIGFMRSEPEVCFRLLKLLGLNLQKSYKLLFSSIN